ncbi:MAG: type II toxin-antitoxin system VapC family toxin [Acidimicrobiales bacterium]
MIVYFDTSALVPLLIDEPTSTTAARLWDEADRVASSRLLYAEARAALARALRLERLDTAEHQQAVFDLDGLVGDLDLVEVTGDLVRRAGALADTAALRGYDAVHLAPAELLNDTDLVLAAGDRQLRDAARGLHITVAELEAPES